MENQLQQFENKKSFFSIFKSWKTWVFAIIFLIIIAAISGDSSKNQPTKVDQVSEINQSTANQQEILSPQIFKIGDKVNLGDYLLVINSVTNCKSDNQFTQPKSGNKFIITDITQENSGTNTRDYNVWDFKLQDDKDFTYQTAFATCKSPAFSAGALQPGQKTRGYITFEIPQNNNPSQLIFTPNWLSSEQIIINLK